MSLEFNGEVNDSFSCSTSYENQTVDFVFKAKKIFYSEIPESDSLDVCLNHFLSLNDNQYSNIARMNCFVESLTSTEREQLRLTYSEVYKAQRTKQIETIDKEIIYNVRRDSQRVITQMTEIIRRSSLAVLYCVHYR